MSNRKIAFFMMSCIKWNKIENMIEYIENWLKVIENMNNDNT